MAYCTKCGNRLSDDARFCTACGIRIESMNNASIIENSKQIVHPSDLTSEQSRTISNEPPRHQRTTEVNKTSYKNWVYSGIAGLVLFFTNPTVLDFYSYARNEVIAQLSKTDDGSTKELNNFVIGLISNVIVQATERSDYIIFSTFAVDLRGLQLFDSNIPSSKKYIGVLGFFIPI